MEIISGRGNPVVRSVVEAALEKLTEDEKKAIENRVSGIGLETDSNNGKISVLFNYTLVDVDRNRVNLNCAIKKDKEGELVRVDEVGGVSMETAVVGAMERFYQLAELELAGGNAPKAVEMT